MDYAAYARKFYVPAGSVPERLVFENVEAPAIVPLVGLLVLQGTALYTTLTKHGARRSERGPPAERGVRGDQVHRGSHPGHFLAGPASRGAVFALINPTS